MRRLRSSLRLPDDPLLRTGVLAMAFALVLVGIVAFASLLAEPIEPAAAVRSSAEPAVEPLTRSDPGVDPWVEKNIPAPRPEPEPEPEPRPDPLPREETDWPRPTQEQVEVVNRPRQYELDPGAILGLTIESLDLYDVPVLDSDRNWALNNGVGHVPETSLPWSQTPERNV